MTWLTGSSSTASTVGSTGGQLATQTATAAPTAVSSGLIGQTGITEAIPAGISPAQWSGSIGQSGITGGTTTPAFAQFPQQSADFAKAVAHPLDTAYEAIKSQAQARMGMGSSSGNGASAGQTPPQTSGAGGILHGMLSGRKTQAPPSGTGEQPQLPSRPKMQFQQQDNNATMAALLQSIFGGSYNG